MPTPKKWKKTPRPDFEPPEAEVPDHLTTDSLHPLGPEYARKEREREEQQRRERAEQKKEHAEYRRLMVAGGVALLAMAEEQSKTFIAQRFAHYSAAVKDLGALGSFPAIEQVRQQLINELVVMGRELHESRVAKAQS